MQIVELRAVHALQHLLLMRWVPYRHDRVGAGRASSIEGESEPENSYKINFFDLRVVEK